MYVSHLLNPANLLFQKQRHSNSRATHFNFQKEALKQQLQEQFEIKAKNLQNAQALTSDVAAATPTAKSSKKAKKKANKTSHDFFGVDI